MRLSMNSTWSMQVRRKKQVKEASAAQCAASVAISTAKTVTGSKMFLVSCLPPRQPAGD
jgi:hypothetical protein